MDIDDHLADEAEHEGLLLGDRAVPLSPEAEHLEEDLDARLYGTTDVQSAIEDGTTNTNAPLLDVFPYLGLPGGGYQTEPGTTKAS